MQRTTKLGRTEEILSREEKEIDEEKKWPDDSDAVLSSVRGLCRLSRREPWTKERKYFSLSSGSFDDMLTVLDEA